MHRRAPPPTPNADSIDVRDVGFKTPECVVWDRTADVYLVSNIHGHPLDKDDNGFISRVRPDGSVEALKWIDGASEGVTLHAPKGMALTRESLWVTDIDVVRRFDRLTGKSLGEVTVEGASYLTYTIDGGRHAPTRVLVRWLREDGRFEEQLADPPPAPLPPLLEGDLLCFRIGQGVAHHLGLVTSPTGEFVHCLRGHGTIQSSLQDPTYRRVLTNLIRPKWASVLPTTSAMVNCSLRTYLGSTITYRKRRPGS